MQTLLLENNEKILFYRATGAYDYLSNLYRCEIKFKDRTFSSSEAAYQFGKANNPKIAEFQNSSTN